MGRPNASDPVAHRSPPALLRKRRVGGEGRLYWHSSRKPHQSPEPGRATRSMLTTPTRRCISSAAAEKEPHPACAHPPGTLAASLKMLIPNGALPRTLGSAVRPIPLKGQPAAPRRPRAEAGANPSRPPWRQCGRECGAAGWLRSFWNRTAPDAPQSAVVCCSRVAAASTGSACSGASPRKSRGLVCA